MALWLVLSNMKAHGLLQALILGQYTVIVAGIGSATVLIASISYIQLEKPFMKLAKIKATNQREASNQAHAHEISSQ